MADFKKQHRLLKSAEYSKVFSKSVKVSNSHFVVLIHKSSLSNPRLGLVISKKVDKRAVQRNRIKRIVREGFREFQHTSSCDYVVIGRPGISQIENKQLFSSLQSLFIQAQKRIKSFR